MPPSHHILTFSEYAAIRHRCPYLVDLTRGGSRLILFGNRHSSDTGDPMFGQIEAIFHKFAPDFALHEGTPPAVEAEREVAIRRHGEAGLLRHLAAAAGIETASMDIPLAVEAERLAGELSPGDALVFLVVRQLASFNRKTARMDFDGYFTDFFAIIGPPLGLAAIDWPLIESEHLRLMGHPLRHSEVTGRETDPMQDRLPTQRIARHSNRRRDERMLSCLADALDTHRRVFASVGVTHAVMLEPALRALSRNSLRS